MFPSGSVVPFTGFARICCVCWLALLFADNLNAQSAPAADVARQQTLAQGGWGSNVKKDDESTEGSVLAAPKMTGDEEYGEQRVLLRRASWAPWSFEVDTAAFYTDNAALSSQLPQSDSYLRSGLRGGYSNRVVGNLFFNAGLDYHTLRHDQFRVFDFDLVRMDLGFMYMLPKLRDTFIVTRYSYYRLMGVELGAPLYQDHIASLGVQKLWKISRGQQIFAGLYGDWSTAPQPWAAGRHEYSFFTGWKLRLTEALNVQLSYRGAYYQYRTGQRNDWNQVTVAAANYDVKDWLRLSLTGSYSVNHSSGRAFDYQNLITGAGVTLHWEF